MSDRPPGVAITPSQTTGPFFGLGLFWQDRLSVVHRPTTPGERIVIRGRVLDGRGEPLPDVFVETWQADHAGRYNHPADPRSAGLDDRSFVGFGRSRIDSGGWFRIETILPGPVPGPVGRSQAPHVLLCVFGRGLVDHLMTRIYPADDGTLEGDPILERVPRERRPTLLARPVGGDGLREYRFDVVLQGEHETVFFELQ